MKFFIDSADVGEISDLATTGLVDGITTNPSLIAATGGDVFEVLREICGLVAGPVSAEVTAVELAPMLAEGRILAGLADNIVIKVPLTPDGLKACRAFADEGIKVNVTLCFSAAQAILAAKSGASFVSPFVGRLDDIGGDGMGLIAEIVEIFAAQPAFATEVLVASIRGPAQVAEAARLGADVATIPPRILRAMYQHPLTDKGLAAFLADWARSGQSILNQPTGSENHDPQSRRRSA